MSDDSRQRTQAHDPVFCDEDGEPMQGQNVAATPNLHLKGVVYTVVMYRCVLSKCRRVKTVTSEVRMPHP